jgi:hypothetical protein
MAASSVHFYKGCGHPDQYHDCSVTAGNWAFWALWLGGVGFVAYEISQIHGNNPASP